MLRKQVFTIKVSDSGFEEDGFMLKVKAATREEAIRIAVLDGWVLL